MNLPPNSILLVPEKTDAERDVVIDAWQRLGGDVQRLGRFWEKPANVAGKKVSVYGNDTFAMVVAQVLNARLISPDDSLVAGLSHEWTKRRMVIQTIAGLTKADFPGFIKPVIPKQFKAKVYQNLEELTTQTEGIDGANQVLLSEVVEIAAEARGFVLESRIMDIALYEGNTDLEAGKQFLENFLKSRPQLPEVYVADLGYSNKEGWFIIEFNACWGAGLNGCNPEKVIACIARATL